MSVPALAWTEVITQLPTQDVSDALYAEVRLHFDEKALVDLTFPIIAINGWNRMNVAFRTLWATTSAHTHRSAEVP